MCVLCTQIHTHTHICTRRSRARCIRWTTWKSDRSPRDRLSRTRMRGRKEISVRGASSIGSTLLPPVDHGHVRENDPAGNGAEDIQNVLCGGRASDLWCNANLSGFYSPPSPPPALSRCRFLFRPSPRLYFAFTFARACSRARRQEQDERRDEVETTAADTSRFFKKIAISRKL